MKKYFNTGRLYIKIISSFMLIVFTAIIVLTIVYSSLYISVAYNKITGEYRNLLSQTAGDIEMLNEEISNIYTAAVSDNNIDVFLNENEYDEMDEYNATKVLQKLRSIYLTKVQSIHLYNRKLNYFISTDYEGGSPDHFVDGSIIKGISESKMIIAREIQGRRSNSQPTEKVLSFIYSDISTDKTLNNSIIINVYDILTMKNIGGNPKKAIFIVDGKGNMISETGLETRKRMVGIEELFNKIHGLKMDIGSFKWKTGGNEKVINFAKVDRLGWYVINVEEYSTITNVMNQKRNQIILISLVMLIISGIVVFMISSNIYTPIELLMEKIAGWGYLKDRKKKKNELNYIMESFAEIVDNMDSLKKNNETNIQELKENFLRRILSEMVEDSYFQKKVDEYPFDIRNGNMQAVVIAIDELFIIRKEHRHIYEHTISKIVHDCLKEKFTYETVKMPESRICTIINTLPYSSGDELEKALYDIKGMIYSTLSRSVTIGIGYEVDSLYEIRLSYEDAVNKINNRFTVGYGQVVDDRFESENIVYSYNYPEDIENEILEVIRMNRTEAFKTVLDKLGKLLANYNYDDALLIFMQISLSCIKTINLITKENERQLYIDFRKFNERFKEMEVLEQGKDWLMELYEQYQRLVNEINLKKNNGGLNKMIEGVETYIKEYYKNCSLSVESLADHFGYTPNYFAKVFKDTTGLFINDYIRKCRLEKARELLRDKEIPIDEIAVSVGFQSKNYFYYTFKKEVGLTPLAYRKQDII